MFGYPREYEMKIYSENWELFSKEGYTASIARKLLDIAVLRVWDAYHLWYHAKRISREGIYLELGSRDGGSVMCAYWAAKDLNLTYVAVEPSPTVPFFENTRTISQGHFVGFSDYSYNVKDKIPDGSVDLLFYDANHGYEETKMDIIDYWPKIKKDGILLCHDYAVQELGDYYDCPGVRQAIDEIFGKEGTVLKNSSIWRIKKDEKKKTQRGYEFLQ